MLIKHVTLSNFEDAFRAHGRVDQFSPTALARLYDHLDASPEQTQLDVVALCCDWSESSPADIRADYGIPDDEDTAEWVERHTTVLHADDTSILYLSF